MFVHNNWKGVKIFLLIKTTNLINNNKYIGIINEDNEDDYFGNSIVIKRALTIFLPENFTREILFYGTEEQVNNEYNKIKKQNKIIFDPLYYNIPENKEEIKQYKEYVNNLNKIENKTWWEENKYKYQTPEFREKLRRHNLGEKNAMYGMKGEKAKNGKAIYQYEDKEHKILINKFNTIRLVLEYLNIKNHVTLNKAIKNNEQYKGYYWGKQRNV